MLTESRLARVSSGIALAAVTVLALSSIGGLVGWMAPVLLPLHWLAARHSRAVTRFIWIALAALTVAEATWILGYLVSGRDSPALWLIAIVALLAVALGFERSTREPLYGTGAR